MEVGYHHLSSLDREEISRGLAMGLSLRSIASSLGRAPSTISREVRRNAPQATIYRSTDANWAAGQRRGQRPRKLDNTALWDQVVGLLQQGWSPQQIAGRLQRDYPDDMSQRVSHETIYAALYVLPRGELRRQLLDLLRQGRKKRLPRSRGQDRRGQIPNITSIHERPPEIETRNVPGHWEGDLLKGARNASAVGTLVERTTRLVVLTKLNDSTAEEVRKAFERRMQRIPAGLRKTLTYDRGKEMAEHETLAKKLRIQVFFADPHSPWQRATMENTNGLLRQYLPKGAVLSSFSQRDLDAIAHKLNTRPRKTLDFATPLEAFDQLLHNPDVALET